VPSAFSAARPTGNLFFDNLPLISREVLRPLLTQVALDSGSIVYNRDDTIERVFFPVGSIISIVLEMADGDTAEVGIIGREGMTGLPAVLGFATSAQRAIVQVPNGAESISVEEFRSVLDNDAETKAFALRYAHATLMTTAQLSACNSLHPTNERCARWLLMAHDRVGADVLPLTQEFLSQMLGVRRGAVTLAASSLQEAGFISYSRGHINIRNRAGLETAACECYETMERDWLATMGYSTRRAARVLTQRSR